MKLAEFEDRTKEVIKSFSEMFNCNLSTVLFATFLTLKLTGNINWSWWWVTSPLWIGIALWLIIVIIMMLILFIGYTTGKIEE